MIFVLIDLSLSSVRAFFLFRQTCSFFTLLFIICVNVISKNVLCLFNIDRDKDTTGYDYTICFLSLDLFYQNIKKLIYLIIKTHHADSLFCCCSLA